MHALSPVAAIGDTAGMRLCLVVLAAVGCYRAPSAAPPANKAPAPDYQRTAADELAFLPSDADFVIGFDVAALRKSQLWQTFQPQFDALMRKVQDQFGSGCSNDLLKDIERGAAAMKVHDSTKFSGVYSMRVANAARALECHSAETKSKGGTVTLDRGVMLTTTPKAPGIITASQAVGSSALVGQFDAGASHDTLAAVLAAGVPLRASPAFMKLYERREPGAVMWGMANGNASVFEQMAASGLRPRSIDGTIVATDRLVITVRMTMAGPAEAAQVASEVDKVKPMAGAYVERLDVRVDGATAQIQVAVTEAQIRSLIAMLGSFGGP